MLTRLPFHAAPLVLLGALMTACGDDGGGAGPGDGGVADGDAQAPSAASLVFSTPAIAVLYGEDAEIAVRYLRADGSPMVGEPVQLGLLGEAHDSSLEARCLISGESVPCLTPRTDASGTAVATVRAGEVAAVFRVQARAPDASPATLDVSVSDAEVGALSVALPYAGSRGVETRSVRLFTQASCGADWTDLLARTPDLSRTVGPMLSAVEFSSLPSSRRYTLLALGRGATPPGGLARPTLALGCVDDVGVTANRRTEVPVRLDDLPVVVDGELAAGIVLVGLAHPPRVGEAVLDTAEEAVATAGGEAALVLDQLEALLVAYGADTALDALEAERAGSGTVSLGTRLGSARQRPMDGANWLAQTLEDAVGTLTTSATLRIAIGEPTPTVWAVEGIRAGADPAAIEIATHTLVGLEIQSTVDWTLPGEVRFAPLEVVIPLGSTAVATIAGLLVREDAPSTAHLLADEVGCSALASWIAGRPSLSAACDAGCVRQVCEASFAAATTGLETRLRALDARRPRVELEGRATLTADADGRLERLTAERLDGTWVTDTDARFDDVSAGVTAAR